MISRSDPEPRKTSQRQVLCVVCGLPVMKRLAEWVNDKPWCRVCVKKLWERK